MSYNSTSKSLLISMCLLLHLSTVAFCQVKITDYKYWMKQLSTPGLPVDPGYTQLLNVLNTSSDSASIFDFFQQMENRSKFASPYINEITHQTTLTEEDWENFKSLFEKIYPGFFLHHREKARDITIAEQRMAALTRLNLTAKQMASMLGISVDSVHKTRQRLRHRLLVPVEINLEESVASL